VLDAAKPAARSRRPIGLHGIVVAPDVHGRDADLPTRRTARFVSPGARHDRSSAGLIAADGDVIVADYARTACAVSTPHPGG
jgi:hypothetical protein